MSSDVHKYVYTCNFVLVGANFYPVPRNAHLYQLIANNLNNPKQPSPVMLQISVCLMTALFRTIEHLLQVVKKNK